MNLVLEKTQRINDSLSSEIQQKENALKNQQATLDKRTRELEILNIQIENLKSSKQEKPSSKLPKMPRDNMNPFTNDGGNGSGNEGNRMGDDHNDRYLIKRPHVSALFPEESCTIVFQVSVDEKGEILGIPAVVRVSTTASDQVLIKKVSALVKSQAKYNPVKGAANTKKTISIQVKPN